MNLMKYINGQVEVYRVIILLPVCFLKANSVVTVFGQISRLLSILSRGTQRWPGEDLSDGSVSEVPQVPGGGV